MSFKIRFVYFCYAILGLAAIAPSYSIAHIMPVPPNEGNRWVMPHYAIGLENIEYHGKRYSVVVLSPTALRPHFIQLGSYLPSRYKDYDQFAEYLMREIQAWVVNQYIEQKRIQAGSDLHAALLTSESALRDRSSVIAITEFNDISKIYAVLRIARTNPQMGLLSLEERLKIKLPRPDITLIPQRSLYGATTFNAYGGIVELKNFVKAEVTPEDFIPLLYYYAERTQVSREADYIQTPVDNKYNPGQFMMSPLEVSQYVLECDSKMVRYYTGLGFKMIRSYPGKDTYVMAVDRLGFIDIGVKFQKRPGYALVWLANFIRTTSIWSPDLESCGALLSGPRPFFQSAD